MEAATATTSPAASAADPLGEIVALLRDIRDQLRIGQAEMLDADGAARLVGMSRTRWLGLVSRGAAPAGVQIGGKLKRWSRTELWAWIDAGCPAASVWRQREQQRRDRARFAEMARRS